VGVSPTILFQLLDWLGKDEAPALRSFPGMGLLVTAKLTLLTETLAMLKDAFTVQPMGEQAERLLAQGGVPRKTMRLIPRATDIPGPVGTIPIGGETR
jgi:hypothetical protein